jgi:hypothetical protein
MLESQMLIGRYKQIVRACTCVRGREFEVAILLIGPIHFQLVQ